MIKDIKDILASEDAYKVYADCMFEPSFEKFAPFAEEIKTDSSSFAFGYFEEDKLVGIIIFRDDKDEVDVLGLSVLKENRKSGIGTALLDYVAENYKKTIFAETDNDTIMFYIKYGFSCKAITVTKNNVTYNRFRCFFNNY